MDQNIKDILAAVNFIKEKVEHLPTEDRMREVLHEVVPGIVALELKPLRHDLKQIDKRLDALEQHYANLKGVTKEIDDLRQQLRVIQKHLGLTSEIAA